MGEDVGLPVADGSKSLAQQITENIQREQLTGMAEARAIASLRTSGPVVLTHAQIAEMLGCTASHVTHRLELLTKLTPKVQEAVEQGKLSVSVAEEITRLVDDDGDIDEEEQEKVARNAGRHGWTVAQTSRYIKKVLSDHVLAESATEREAALTQDIRVDLITQMERMQVRDDLSKADVIRGALYLLLLNSLDQELLDVLHERHNTPYEHLFEYIASLTNNEVQGFFTNVVIRGLSAAHFYVMIEESARRFFEDETEPVTRVPLPPPVLINAPVVADSRPERSQGDVSAGIAADDDEADDRREAEDGVADDDEYDEHELTV